MSWMVVLNCSKGLGPTCANVGKLLVKAPRKKEVDVSKRNATDATDSSWNQVSTPRYLAYIPTFLGAAHSR